MSSLSRAADSFVDELTTLIEPKRKPGRRRLEYTLVERGDEFECYRARREGPSLVGRGSLEHLGQTRLPRKLREQPIEFRLDGSRVLTKLLQFPAASRGYLDAIVQHQLDRATPWASDRVVYDYAVAEDEPASDGQIAVRLVATSREVFERSMRRLDAAKIKASVVGTSEDPIDQPSSVNLLHSDRTERRSELRRKVMIGLAAFVAVALVLSLLSGWRLYSLEAQAAELQAETNALRARLEAARGGDGAAATAAQLIADKRSGTPMVTLIDKLSGIIPTSTYLTELAVEDDQLRIAGLTDDAPALIGILEGSDILSDVRFVAPTMRDEGETRDRFEIAAAVATTAPGE